MGLGTLSTDCCPVGVQGSGFSLEAILCPSTWEADAVHGSCAEQQGRTALESSRGVQPRRAAVQRTVALAESVTSKRSLSQH